MLTLVPEHPREDPVPVTAKLSRKFYETLGDEIANELVEWFNLVDATYRADLRELNELNFARFDAKLEQRIAQLETKLESLESKLVKWMFLFWVGTLGTLVALAVLKV